ncbi:hypothetical protein SORBI_3002G328250 [Sorghum bicolor]|uniref:Uncharacterized protein n=1 Tax=Sorghum bicolor TaxID=4558 RepID=A0A1B6QEQ6_SORBI|nr:hypothetical protein SORBI_3002G328250 [Sorghum bicolor]
MQARTQLAASIYRRQWFLPNEKIAVSFISRFKSRRRFFMRKRFLQFSLSFFINHVATSAFYICDVLFNEDRNCLLIAIGTALTRLFVDKGLRAVGGDAVVQGWWMRYASCLI